MKPEQSIEERIAKLTKECPILLPPEIGEIMHDLLLERNAAIEKLGVARGIIMLFRHSDDPIGIYQNPHIAKEIDIFLSSTTQPVAAGGE